jgi:hypothetical protein
MSQSDEFELLKRHLSITEKSVINYMEENDEEKDKVEKTSFNLNNLKIKYVKELCEKLKNVDLRKYEEDSKPTNIPCLISGSIKKKSDKNITWEE